MFRDVSHEAPADISRACSCCALVRTMDSAARQKEGQSVLIYHSMAVGTMRSQLQVRRFPPASAPYADMLSHMVSCQAHVTRTHCVYGFRCRSGLGAFRGSRSVAHSIREVLDPKWSACCCRCPRSHAYKHIWLPARGKMYVHRRESICLHARC